MKKQTAVKIVSFSLAAVVAAFGFVVKNEIKSRRYEIEIKNSYSYSLDELSTAVNNISMTLTKARFSATPASLSNMAAKLLTEAEISKNALSQLPAGNQIETLNRFLSQVGNYAMSVSKSLINNGEITQSDSQNLELLSLAADKISQIVDDSRSTFNNPEYWAEEINQKVTEVSETETLASSLSQLEDELTDYPTLIYDGPYSDHILEKEPEMIKNAKKVSEKKALTIAQKTADSEYADLKLSAITEGHIPAFRFSSEELDISISQSGGYPIYMRRNRTPKQSILRYEQVLEKAKRYLTKMGYNDMQETYYYIQSNICVINFAFVDGETICYTDLIKVGVAMDNGEIMLLETSGYITNHKDRAFETPIYREEAARELVNSNLNIYESSMALIPTAGGNEARCYEFACTSSDSKDILIYINALNLNEEEILILLKSDNGVLTK